MDMTEKYSKMCDNPLIQNQWTPTIGDFVRKRGDADTVVYVGNGREIFLADAVGDECMSPTPTDGVIWLPRLDQLWDMLACVTVVSTIFTYMANTIGSMAMHPYHDNDGSVNWHYSREFTYWDSFDTPEKLFLAFAMQKLHAKRWDTEKGTWI